MKVKNSDVRVIIIVNRVVFIFGVNSMRGIFNYFKIIFFGKFIDCCYIVWLVS